MSEKIKVLFPEGVETITITKNDYDRLYGELTYKNIILQQKVEQLEKEIEALQNCLENTIIDYQQLENIRKEIKEYIEKHVVCCKSGDMLVEFRVDDLLNILNKGSDKE